MFRTVVISWSLSLPSTSTCCALVEKKRNENKCSNTSRKVIFGATMWCEDVTCTPPDYFSYTHTISKYVLEVTS